MPGGRVGVQLLAISIRFTILVTAFCTYFLIGFFGAARWGESTAGDILENEWGQRYYNGVLNILLAVYLALSIPPILYPCAHILQDWIPVTFIPIGVFRRFVIVSIIMAVSLGISLAFPGVSATITVITGCTGGTADVLSRPHSKPSASVHEQGVLPAARSLDPGVLGEARSDRGGP
eukprot:jgi/Botrbrau1/17504/Bobra.0054s0080.1